MKIKAVIAVGAMLSIPFTYAAAEEDGGNIVELVKLVQNDRAAADEYVRILNTRTEYTQHETFFLTCLLSNGCARNLMLAMREQVVDSLVNDAVSGKKKKADTLRTLAGFRAMAQDAETQRRIKLAEGVVLNLKDQ